MCKVTAGPVTLQLLQAASLGIHGCSDKLYAGWLGISVKVEKGVNSGRYSVTGTWWDKIPISKLCLKVIWNSEPT